MTSEVNQPSRPATPLADSVALGAVVSILIVTESELLPPVLRAEQDDDNASASAVKCCVPQPESMTTVDSGSVTDQATVTSEMYQPLVPDVPITVLVITGG